MMKKTNGRARIRRPGWLSLLKLSAFDLGRLSVGDLDAADAIVLRTVDKARSQSAPHA